MMTYAKKTLIYFLVQTSIGIVGLLVTLFVNLPDSYRESLVSGIASGLISSGILGIVISIRLIRSPKKAMEAEIAKNEERTQLIRMKTSSSTYSVALYFESFCTILAGLLGFKTISIVLSIVLIVQLITYFGFANYYWKKY